MTTVARGAGGDPSTLHYSYVAGANTLFGSTGNNLPTIPRKLYILSSGNLQMLDDANTWITYPVTAGQILDFRPTRIGHSSTANVACWA